MSTTPQRSRSGLPAYPTAFVGRTDELGQIEAGFAVAPAVTLRGPGGIGKTRLATEYSRASRRRSPDRRVSFCDLSGARDAPAGLISVAEGVGAPDHALTGGDDPFSSLARWLVRRGPRLLVLDNCEHLLGFAREVVGAFLAEIPDLRVLATSREALGVPQEQLIEVGALDRGEAASLFVDRAEAVGRRVTASQERELLDGILERLGGHPLAIELAAARTELLPLREVARRLAQPLTLLRDPTARIEDRHGSLWRAIAASWELLRPWEQAALQQCSVFVGGIPLDAAEAVFDLPVGTSPDAPSVLDALHSLVRQSLARAVGLPDEEPRVALFEAVAEFAAVMLTGSGGTAEAQDRHAHWFSVRGAEWRLGATGPDAGAHRARLGRELGNLRAALAFTLGGAGPETARRAVSLTNSVLETLTARQGRDQSLALLTGTLDHVAAHELGPSPELASLWARRGQAEQLSGDLAAAERSIEQLQRLCQEGAMPDREIDALGSLGNIAGLRGQADRSQRYFEQALERAERAGDLRRQAQALSALATSVDIRRNDDWVAAEAKTARAVALLRELGDQTMFGWFVIDHGGLLRELGRLEASRAMIEEGLSIAREAGYVRGQLSGLLELAATLHLDADLDGATAAVDEAGEIAARLGLPRFVRHHWVHRGLLRLERLDLPGAALAFIEAMDAGGEPKGRFRGLGALVVALRSGLCDIAGDPASSDALRTRAVSLLEGAGPGYGAAPLLRERLCCIARARRAVEAGELERARAELSQADQMATSPAGPDRSVFAIAERAVDALSAATRARLSAWRLAADGTWFSAADGERVDLARRPVLARLLTGLLRQRLERPGEGLDIDALTELGWPGETMLPKAARNRVYVAVSTLRKAGLELLHKSDAGYFLDPSVPVVSPPE